MIPFMLEALGCVAETIGRLNKSGSIAKTTTLLSAPAIATATFAVNEILKSSQKQKEKNINENITTYTREKSETLKIFQRNLSNLRNLGGLSIEKVGEMLDITRQAVWSLENGKTNITATQYIAWRSILELPAKTTLFKKKEGDYLKRALRIFTDETFLYSDEELKKYEKILDQLVRAKKAGLDEDIIDTIAQNLPD